MVSVSVISLLVVAISDGTLAPCSRIADEDVVAFGTHLATLGDINGDGHADVVVGSAGFELEGDPTYPASNWVLMLDHAGDVRQQVELSPVAGTLAGAFPSGYSGGPVVPLGDQDSDGICDLVIGEPNYNGDGTFRGAIWLLRMDKDGQAQSATMIGEGVGGFRGELLDRDRFGSSIAVLGDINGDGISDIAVGATQFGATRNGEVWILFMTLEGTVMSHQKISHSDGGIDEDLVFTLFGSAIAAPGDLNGDGVPDMIVGARQFDSSSGAVFILNLNRDGTVLESSRIDNEVLLGQLDQPISPARFGTSLTMIDDLDSNGFDDLAVGAPGVDGEIPTGGINNGAVWIIFLGSQGSVLGFQEISATNGGFTGQLFQQGAFGTSVASPGDINNDGVADLAVGHKGDGDSGHNRGAVWILFLNADGTVSEHRKITEADGFVGPGSGFSGFLTYGDAFGSALCPLGDLDGDGIVDVAIGAPFDDEVQTDRGAVWVLFMNDDGTVRDEQKISDDYEQVTGFDFFGMALACAGDLDGDGVPDLIVGEPNDDGGGHFLEYRGAIWIEFLNTDGTIHASQKINTFEGGLVSGLNVGDAFGSAMAMRPLSERVVAVGAPGDSEGGNDHGVIWLLTLDIDGMVIDEQRVGSIALGGVLPAGGRLGSSLAWLDENRLITGLPGDESVWVITFTGRRASAEQLNTSCDIASGDAFGHSLALFDAKHDGVLELLVGAPGDDGTSRSPFADRGAIWIMPLNDDGYPTSCMKLGDATGGFTGILADGDAFGTSVSHDGRRILVGAPGTDVTGTNRGITWAIDLSECAGDADGSGTVDVDDLLSVILNWLDPSGTADLDHNGLVDDADLFLVIDNWGACGLPPLFECTGL